MQELFTRLSNLNRPRLLVRAARIGAADYQRDLHLSRALMQTGITRTSDAVARLLEIEEEIDTQRRAGDAAYSIVRHIDVLIALIAEARTLRNTRPEGAVVALPLRKAAPVAVPVPLAVPQINASGSAAFLRAT